MNNKSSLIVKVATCIGAVATMAFAGVEPSPFLPFWKIIIFFFGG